ncbi:cAMP-dependent protein kinase type II regulatory subunit-like [Centruroides sculpturatus]|uniref:cAMP-dependent protein kinase type II regulatory subunit-like n=1 Tax=Centruroides sculpturatus TaxID=218467 RepID=UPI000C6C890B|nr:cAMP-dependent protein kinase type II regulatory subunit-like [Centruroides sculpturatus]
MSHARYEVPPELTNLLLDFTVNVLLERPSDILEYAANYFNQLREERLSRSLVPSVSDSEDYDDEPMPGMLECFTVKPAMGEPAVDCGGYTRIRRNSAANLQAQFDLFGFELSPTFEEPPVFTRRKSVFAEQYNPEDDDDDDIEEQMQEVLDAMFERKVQPGDIVIKQGDDGDNFYIIQHGLYHVFVSTDKDEKGNMVGKYEDSGSFGELALMYNMPRAATVEAVTNGSLWAMNRQTFRRIVLKNAFKKRKEYEQLLESVPMLKSLEPYERMNLCDALMPKQYTNGELIIRQDHEYSSCGDKADGMYFIEEGTVRVTMVTSEGPERGKQVEMSRLKKGEYFGELALVTQKPRAASVYAIGNVKLAFLDVHAFERLLGPCMDIMRRNIEDYEKQIVDIFGSKANVPTLR